MNVNKWKKGIGTALCALGLLLPTPVLAAGKDRVTFEKADEQSAAVTVVAEHAAAEQTTAAALQLKVTVTEGEADVSFEFSEEIPAEVTGSRYVDGVLYVYAASGKSIFGAGDELLLGNVVIKAKSEAALATVEVISETIDSDGEDGTQETVFSFQTANRAYGIQEHIVDEIPDAVELSAKGDGDGNSGESGSGSEDGNDGEDGNGGGDGNGNGDGNGSEDSNGSGHGSNGGSGSGNNGAHGGSANVQQGLNDTTVQQVTDPNGTVKIPTAVIPGTPGKAPLPDLSLSEKTEGSSGKVTGGKDKVTVVRPADGPSAIIVEENEVADAGSADIQEKPEGAESVPSGKNEIALDKENGGALQKEEKSEKITLAAIVVTAVTAAAGAAGGLLLWRKKSFKSGKGRKTGKKKNSSKR